MSQDQATRQRLLCYCAQQAKHLENPTYRDCKIGNLKRYFDNLPQDNFVDYIPSFIQSHIARLDEAVINKTLKLWSYRLAAYVQVWLLDAEFKLQQDIISQLQHVIDGMHRSFLSVRLPVDELENSLCQAYALMISQYLLSIDHEPQTVQKIGLILKGISYINPHEVDTLSRQQLLKQYKLLCQDESHLQFWDQQVSDGIFGKNGKSISTANGNIYQVPTGVHAIMTDSAGFHGSYYQLTTMLHQTRKSRHDKLLQIGRSAKTTAFYELKPQDVEFRKIKYL